MGRKLLHWLGRAVLGFVALLIVLACAGAIYQAIGNWRDARRFPQQGRPVQVGQMKLNLDCTGQGSPTVILDSGSGVPALGWIKVQPEIAKFTHVCSYDRAGYGWSEPGPEPRTSLQIAKELRALLDAAGEHGPYVLVGHSFGGFNIRVFTGQYPSEVGGIVLVDASHEDEEERTGSILPPAVKAEQKEVESQAELMEKLFTPPVIHLGLQRLAIAAGWADPPSYFSKDLFEEFAYLEQQSKTRKAVDAEGKVSSQSADQVRSAGNLGDRPLIVLTAGKPYGPDPLLTTEMLAKQKEIWIDVLQVEEAHLSTGGKQIVVPDSGHMIPFERPDTIVAAVREVWSAASAHTLSAPGPAKAR